LFCQFLQSSPCFLEVDLLPRVLKYEPDSTTRLLLNLCRYFGGDLQKVLDELLPMLENGRTFNEAYEVIVNTHGLERSFE